MSWVYPTRTFSQTVVEMQLHRRPPYGLKFVSRDQLKVCHPESLDARDKANEMIGGGLMNIVVEHR